METKHTPGPWFSQGETVYALDETGTVNRFSVGIQRGYVLDSHHKANRVMTSSAEMEATAKLIAAAPDLLEALRDLCDAWDLPGDGRIGGGKYNGNITQAQTAARAAIAKATGAA